MTLFGHPLHPMTVHFPIAFYFLGMVLTVIYLWRDESSFEIFAYWSFLASLITTIIASLSGLVDQGQLQVDDPRQNSINNHITAGISLIVLNGLVVYMRSRWPDVLQRYRWLYLTLMVAGGITVVIAGWLGGVLVYQLGVGVNLQP